MKVKLAIIIMFLLAACCRPMSPQRAASRPQKCGCGSIR